MRQVDVKSAFLNGILQEEAYNEQPKRFVNLEHHDYVYKLNNALYGLKQAQSAWYEILTNCLLNKEYKRGGVDKTMFLKKTA